MKEKILFVTDMDGTLLGPDSLVSRRSAQTISRLSAEGALITVATARTPATVVPLLESTRLQVPAIVMTGAAMWDFTTRRYLHPVLFGPGVARRLAGTMASAGVNPFVYTLAPDGCLTVTHCGQLTKAEDAFYQERRGLELKRFLFNPSGGYGSDFPGAILLLGMGPMERIMELGGKLREWPELSVSAYSDIFNPHLAYIEVFAAGVSKAAAIGRLRSLTGATRVIAYGDNLNDLPMFEEADEAVAVANARPGVAEKATRVIGPNSADSVALDMEAVWRSIS